MQDKILLNDQNNINQSNDLDSLFTNLAKDINTFNRYVDGVNRRKKENSSEEKSILEEKQRIAKAKLEFEEYARAKQVEYDKKINQADEYMNIQKQNILKSEEDFRASMNKSLNDLALAKQQFEIEKQASRQELENAKRKFEEEKDKFEKYKEIEQERIKHEQELLELDRTQFEKYQEVANKKIQLENKEIEQNKDKLKDMVGQFVSSFKSIIDENKEV